MAEPQDTEELRRVEAERAATEAELADESTTEEERRAHARRSDKADYLRHKLDEQAQSEQAQSEQGEHD